MLTPSLTPKHVIRYLARWGTAARQLSDEALAQCGPRLHGKVIELGGLGDGRKRFVPNASEYIVTNVGGKGVHLDATAMNLPDESVDGFISESMLEHVDDPAAVVAEVHRVLRPGGRFLLIVPWTYPYHSAPDDFHRFSSDALRNLLAPFGNVEIQPLGNFWSAMATFAQLKVSPWKPMRPAERLGRIVLGSPLLGLGLLFYSASVMFREADDFAICYCAFAEKDGALRN